MRQTAATEAAARMPMPNAADSKIFHCDVPRIRSVRGGAGDVTAGESFARRKPGYASSGLNF